MNCSIAIADRTSHFKIIIIAGFCSLPVWLVAMMLH
jgi:hypothetical protein